MTSPVRQFIDRLDTALETDDPQWLITLTVGRRGNIHLLCESEQGEIGVRVAGIVPRLSVNGQDCIHLSIRDRYDLFIWRRRTRRRFAELNRSNLASLL